MSDVDYSDISVFLTLLGTGFSSEMRPKSLTLVDVVILILQIQVI